MEFDIVDKLSPNFTVGRSNFEPKAFVIHVGEGTFESNLNWITNKSSGVSYHFLIREDGKIYRIVDTNNTAWHTGLAVNPTWKGHTIGRNPNLETIGIAFSGYAASGPTLKQILAARAIILKYSAIHRIPLTKDTIVGHNEIRTDKLCPGPKVNLQSILWLCSLK
jgi:N-acetyl-anhydromuramyl-L-alanine amidase AmpD